jgi:hypothetical protein
MRRKLRSGMGDISIIIVTRLRDGRQENQGSNLSRSKIYFLLTSIHTGSGAHLEPWDPFPGLKLLVSEGYHSRLN